MVRVSGQLKIDLEDHSGERKEKYAACRQAISGCFPIVIVEESSQARSCFNDAVGLSRGLVCMNDEAIQSLMTTRRCFSPSGIILFMHSDLIDKTKRSANAFKLGLRAGWSPPTLMAKTSLGE